MNTAMMTAEEIRAVLIKKYKYSQEDADAIKGKAKLAMTLMHEINSDNDFFASIQIETPKLTTARVEGDNSEKIEEQQEEKRVVIGSPEWEDYVLSLLTSNEVEVKDGKKYPKANGLRRVAQNVLGAIIESGPIQVFPPADGGPGRATVIYEVAIEWKYDTREVYSDNDIVNYEPRIRRFRAAADCWLGNSPDKYAIHPVATAETKAEGRALKRALCLSLSTAEEVDNDKNATEVIRESVVKETKAEWNGEEKIQLNQVVSITKMCDRLKIDISKLINEMFPEKFNLDDLSKANGAQLMVRLNKYQSKDSTSLEIPDSVKKEVE